jgi:uncharacterized protein YqeY
MPSEIADRLKADVIVAMKAKDKETLGILRQVQAAIKRVEVDERTELDQDGVIDVLMKYAKQVRDSLDAAENAGRDDLAAAARTELDLVQSYLPAALSDDELVAMVDAAIAETGAQGPKDMGTVIKAVMTRVKGRAEGARVSAAVKSRLVGRA